MAFEKAKVLKAAEKFLSQGKIDAAIKEYRQIVENDDNDLTTLNMLGDLCVRAGHNDEAIDCFTRIAEHYREQEFSLKAIAMYKKIDRLKPRDPAIAHKLATLYATQGLAADARAQYLIVADAYTRAGMTKQTLEVLHKVADLDPHNTDIRLKLAEGYLKEGLQEDAAAAFMEAATRLYETGQFEKSLNGYSNALNLSPGDQSALQGVVSAHVALGAADEAAELLEKVIGESSNDPKLIAMLAHTYIEAENAKGAERAVSMLMAQDASNYTRFVEVAQLYLRSGEVDETTRLLASITEQLLAGREENDLLELVNEVLARNPEHVEALRLLVRVHWWQRDMEKLRSALERLAEAAEAAGLADEERYALVQLVRLAPDEQTYSDRLAALGGVPDDMVAGPASNLETALSQIPSFESFPERHSGWDQLSQDSGVGSEQPLEFEWNTVAEQAPLDPSSSFADLNETVADSAFRLGSQTDPIESSAEVFEFSGALTNTAAPAAVENVAVEDTRMESMIRQELESVDFYITQGYGDIATDTLDLLERQFGSHEEIDARREKLKAAALATSAVEQTPATSDEVFDFGGWDSLAADQEIGAAGVVPKGDIDFAIIEETGSEAQELSGGSSSAPILSKGRGIDAGLAEIFEEFRVAAEDEPAEREDYETHYNMGTAYKEMDLLDEAIQEFQTAAALCHPTDNTPRYLQCCNMLGHCFVQKGMPRAAVLWFEKGLDAPGHSEEEYKGLRYELALAYEQMGDLKRALDVFTEVYGVDVSYRGVAEKLRELEAQRPGKKAHK
jgi:tetratricopeptide (TPR) repeat protein